MATEKRYTLVESALVNMLNDAWSRGFDVGHQQGTEEKRLELLNRLSRESHRRILRDLLPTAKAKREK